MNTTNSDDSKGCSLVIPVYNEQGILQDHTQRLVDFMNSLSQPYELLIVSNGSKDGTVNLGLMMERRFPAVRFFHLPKKGVGNAFQAAINQSNFSYLLSLDMDLSVDLTFVPKAIELLGQYHMVIGSKKTGRQQRSWVRQAGSGTFILCARFLLGLPFDDYSIGAKAYHRAMVTQFVERINHGTSYVLEVAYLAKKSGHRLISIPVKCVDLRGSRFNLAHEAVYRFHHLFRLWLTEARRRRK